MNRLTCVLRISYTIYPEIIVRIVPIETILYCHWIEGVIGSPNLSKFHLNTRDRPRAGHLGGLRLDFDVLGCGMYREACIG